MVSRVVLFCWGLCCWGVVCPWYGVVCTCVVPCSVIAECCGLIQFIVNRMFLISPHLCWFIVSWEGIVWRGQSRGNSVRSRCTGGLLYIKRLVFKTFAWVWGSSFPDFGLRNLVWPSLEYVGRSGDLEKGFLGPGGQVSLLALITWYCRLFTFMWFVAVNSYRRKSRDCPGLGWRRGKSSPKWRELEFSPLECVPVFSGGRLLTVWILVVTWGVSVN